MKKTEKEETLEQAMKKLEDIIDTIEDDDTPVEKAIQLYREGVELSLHCSKKLKSYDMEIMLLSQTIENEFNLKPLAFNDITTEV